MWEGVRFDKEGGSCEREGVSCEREGVSWCFEPSQPLGITSGLLCEAERRREGRIGRECVWMCVSAHACLV